MKEELVGRSQSSCSRESLHEERSGRTDLSLNCCSAHHRDLQDGVQGFGGKPTSVSRGTMRGEDNFPLCHLATGMVCLRGNSCARSIRGRDSILLHMQRTKHFQQTFLPTFRLTLKCLVPRAFLFYI